MIAKSTYHKPEFFNNGFRFRVDFRDDRFLKRFNKAKMTMFRLMSKGELYKIRAKSNHIGWGNYEYIILDADCWRKKYTEVNIPPSVFDGKQTTIKVCLTNNYGKTFFDGKIEMSENTFNLYARSPYGKMELVYEGNKAKEAARSDARRVEWTDIDVLEVMAWQEYCEYVSTYNVRLFEKEIESWRIKEVERMCEHKFASRDFVHPSISKKAFSLLREGMYYDAKAMINNCKKYVFARNAQGKGTAKDSSRQLRALGFVA